MRHLALSGAAALTLLSCTHLQDKLVAGIEEERRLQQACSPFTALPTEVPPSFIGDDLGSYERMRVSMGTHSGDRITKILEELKRHQSEIQVLLKKNPDQLESPELSELTNALKRTVDDVEKLKKTWPQVSRDLKRAVSDIQGSNFVSSMNECAKHKLVDDPSVGSCAWTGSLPEFISNSQGLYSQVTNLVKDIRDMRRAISKLRSRSPDTGLREVVAGLDSQIVQLLAFDGILLDADLSISTLQSTDLSHTEKMGRVAQWLVSLQSDRVVDIILYWLGRGITRLEAQLRALDESTYGLSSATYALAGRTDLLNDQMCKLASYIQEQLEVTGLGRSAFGARTCHALFHEREQYPDSQMMTNILKAILFASTDQCSGHGGDESVEFIYEQDYEDNPVPPDEPFFRDLAIDEEQLEQSMWDSRVTLAASRLAEIESIERLSVADIPLRRDIPAMLPPSLWASRRLNSATIDALEAKDPELAFSFVLEGALELGGPYADENRQTICPKQGGPAFCYESHEDTTIAVREVAYQLCKQNATQARLDEAILMCAYLSSPELNCTPTSKSILVTVSEKFDDMDYQVPEAELEALGTVLTKMSSPVVVVTGRASSKLPSDKNAKKLLEAVISDDDKSRCSALAGLRPESNSRLRDSPGELELGMTYWSDVIQESCGELETQDPSKQLTTIANRVLADARAIEALRILRAAYPKVCEGARCVVRKPELEAKSPDTPTFRSVSVKILLANEVEESCLKP